jgi:predicted Zn-dependent protease
VIIGEMSQIVRSKKSVGKKTLELLGLGIVGGTGLTLVNHMNEIEADVKAKKNLKKAGFDEKAGEKFLKKTKHSVSFSHPASNLRNDILKSLK